MIKILASVATAGLMTVSAIVPVHGQNREVSRADAATYERAGNVLERRPEIKKRVMSALKKGDERQLRALAREAGVDVSNMEGSAFRYWCKTGFYHNLWINDDLVLQCADEAEAPSLAAEGAD